MNPPQERSGDILSGVDRVDSKLVDCIKMAESTLQNKKQKPGGGICGRSGKTNPRLVWMGPSFSKKSQNLSPKPAHSQILEPADSLFDQDFDQFMNNLNNFEPFDDLEDWSDNVDLFMEAIAHHPRILTPSGYWPSSKRKNPMLLNNPASQFSTNPGLKSPKD